MVPRFILPIFLALSAIALAEPVPNNLENRQFSEFTSAVGGGITSIFGDVTSKVVSIATDVGSQVTHAAGEIFTEVVSQGGNAYTVVTQAGGGALTLATNGAGVVTSFGGHVWTVAPGAVSGAFTSATGAAGSQVSNFTSRPNAGEKLPIWSLSAPITLSLAAVFGGLVVGARLIV